MKDFNYYKELLKSSRKAKRDLEEQIIENEKRFSYYHNNANHKAITLEMESNDFFVELIKLEKRIRLAKENMTNFYI